MDCDVVVVGAGLAGAAAAWELTARGRSVIVLEAESVGHRRGSSHGTSRIYRRAYADPFYVELTGRAESGWQRLEKESGATLRVQTGGIDSGGGRDLSAMADTLAAQGVPAELVPARAATERWPGMLFDGPVLFHEGAGYLNPDATIPACLAVAVSRGAVVHEQTPMLSLEPSSAGVTVHTEGRSFSAAQVVVAAGAWLPDLTPSLGVAPDLPPLVVKQQETFHFRHRDPGVVWPTVVHKDRVQLYALPSGADGGPEPAVKVAQFDSESATSATGRDYRTDARARAVVLEHVERWMPGLDPEITNEQSCLFTMTPNEDFVLDRVGPVVVASPCSGHGAKFTPLIGELIADLVDGRPPLPRFAFRR